jgi:hypothetical protein
LSVNCHRGVITLLCADLKEGNARLCCIPFGLLSDAPRRSSRPVLQLGRCPFVGLIGVTGCGGIWNSELLCQAGRDESKRMTAYVVVAERLGNFRHGSCCALAPRTICGMVRMLTHRSLESCWFAACRQPRQRELPATLNKHPEPPNSFYP